jgi:butyryl-CoA dehydrogenase
MFLIEKDSKGLSFGKIYNRLGFKGTSGRDTYLDECFVPKENLLGVEGEGLKYLGAIVGKYIFLGAAAISLGIAEAALRDSIKHVKTRTIAGKTLSEHQSVAFTISEMSQLVNSARSLLYAASIGGGAPVEPSPLWTMQAKIYASEVAVKVTDMAMQLHGGHGYCSDLPIERYLRDARGLTMHFGTSEMLKINVANALIK